MRGNTFLKRPAILSIVGKAIIRRKVLYWSYNNLHRDCSTVGNSFSLEREASETREAIQRNTEITRAHLTPEIRLHLLTPNCPLYHSPAPSSTSEDLSREYESERIGYTFREPFWSIYWPGGQALTRFVLDHGEDLFPNGTRAVLDLGAGCGAAAIAAKLRGAVDVVANDIDPVACIAAEMNAALNNIRLTTSRDNLIARSYGAVQGAESFDVIFVGDLLYDEEITAVLEPWLDEAIRQGTRVYLGDPGRHGVTEKLRRRLRKLETYPLPENVRKENYGFDSATVWQLFQTSDETLN